MAKKEKSEKDSNWAGEIETYSRQIWLAGLGAYVKAGKEGFRFFENLVKKGEMEEKAARGEIEKQVKNLRKTGEEALAEAETQTDKPKKKLTGKWNELESAFQQRMEGAVSRLGVPTRDELKTLEAKIDELTIVVGELAAKKSTTTKAKPKAASTARKAPAKAESKPKAASTARKAPAKAENKPKAASTTRKAPAKAESKPKATSKAKPADKSEAAAKPEAATKPEAAAAPKAPAAANTTTGSDSSPPELHEGSNHSAAAPAKEPHSSDEQGQVSSDSNHL